MKRASIVNGNDLEEALGMGVNDGRLTEPDVGAPASDGETRDGPMDIGVTDDFVSTFSTPKARAGAMGHIIGFLGLDMLPVGVDSSDPRVIEIVRQCRAGE